ncbi:putative anthocyanidin reductase [Amaranthus tricolor]|uniref:putative anthocyanidin reductase n=1 Tax=Amaranthus tricolor TaxID=29722 RepID=UPI002582B8A3|nr:putative anthocyanidin reductase [Amaranthus tricolor]
MAEENSSRYCKVCVTGGAGYIASSLIKHLLNNGSYFVHATLRNLGDTEKLSRLTKIPGAETRLKVFEADVFNPQQFEAAIRDCQFVFHVASPFVFPKNSQFKDISEAAIASVLGIAKLCIESGTVKRLIYTASVVGVSPLKDDGNAFMDFIDETCWTPLHIPLVTSSIHKDYIISKTEAERALLKLEEGSKMEVVTLALGLVAGEASRSHYHEYSSPALIVSQITKSEFGNSSLKLLEQLLGKLPILHIEDACQALIFSMVKDSLHGRFLCASDYVSSAEIAHYFHKNYPEFQVQQVHMDGPTNSNIKWASTKLIDEGFNYNHDMKSILDDSLKNVRRFNGL